MASPPNYRWGALTNETIRRIQALTTLARIVRAEVLPYFALVARIAGRTFAHGPTIGFNTSAKMTAIIARTTAAFDFTGVARKTVSTFAHDIRAVDLHTLAVILAWC